MRRTACIVSIAAMLASACSPHRVPFETPDGTASVDGATTTDAAPETGSDVQGFDVGPPVDTAPNVDMTIVYAHSDTTLYAIDPHNNAFTTIGAFAFPADGNTHTMTDLAVDASGGLVGVTQNALYRIDPMTAACTLLSPLPGNHLFVGLTYLPMGVLDPSNEVLVGGATDGTYWRIDAMTGVATQLGTFQGGWKLSGDIVSVAGAATYATVRRTSGSTDSLATIDPGTGAVTILGDTHFHSIFGLGYWRSTLYGFTRTGQFIVINSTNGQSTMISTPTPQFSGAGVTTLAPTAPP